MSRIRNEENLVGGHYYTLTGLIYSFVETDGTPVRTAAIHDKIQDLFIQVPDYSTVNKALVWLRNSGDINFDKKVSASTRKGVTRFLYLPAVGGINRFEGMLMRHQDRIATSLGGVVLQDALAPFIATGFKVAAEARQLLNTT